MYNSAFNLSSLVAILEAIVELQQKVCTLHSIATYIGTPSFIIYATRDEDNSNNLHSLLQKKSACLEDG